MTRAIQKVSGGKVNEATETSPLLDRNGGPSSTSHRISHFPAVHSDESDESSLTSSSLSSNDEESLAGPTPVEGSQSLARATIAQIILVLLIGVFVLNADGSLVLATHPIIASEFNALESSSWLFTGFSLAGAATQIPVRLINK
jgi:hypothetical protein